MANRLVRLVAIQEEVMLRLLAVSVIGLIAVLAQSAQAQTQQPACTARADVISHLSKKYSESPVSIGLANNGGVIEILSSKTGTSWTIIITMPNGMACMIAAGENWESVPRVAQIDPST